MAIAIDGSAASLERQGRSIQAFSPPGRLDARSAADYPHRVHRLHARAAGGLSVLSKVAIREEEVLPAPPEGWFPAQRLVFAGGVQALHVHLRPAWDQGSWITGYQTTPPFRLAQVQAYFPRLNPDLPTFWAGDFNELPSGLAVQWLAEQGVARVPTAGPTTWRYSPKGWSLLSMDLDHFLVDARLAASDAVVVDAGASDHRPLLVTLARK